MEQKGKCKHGEFDLLNGCPDCVAERIASKNAIADAAAKIESGHALEVAEVEHKADAEAISRLEVQAVEVKTMAVVKIAPGKDAIVQALLDEVLKLQRYAQERVIASNDDVKTATNDMAIIQGVKKRIVEKQKEYLDPINEHVKAVRDAFNLLLDPLAVADKLTRDKILEYRDTLRKLEEARRQTEELQAKLEQREPTPAVTVEQPIGYRAELGRVGAVKNWKWGVEDFAKVPDMYKVIDAVKVNKVIRGGGSIPGIKAWQEESLRVTGS